MNLVSNKMKNSRTELIQLLGGKCKNCEANDVEMLQLDHINDDGSQDRKIRGPNIYAYYLNHPEEARETLQVLCASHNWKKRYQVKKDLVELREHISHFERTEETEREPSKFFEKSPDGWIRWKEQEPNRPSPASMLCPHLCANRWQLMLDRVNRVYYLRCADCGFDLKMPGASFDRE